MAETETRISQPGQAPGGQNPTNHPAAQQQHQQGEIDDYGVGPAPPPPIQRVGTFGGNGVRHVSHGADSLGRDAQQKQGVTTCQEGDCGSGSEVHTGSDPVEAQAAAAAAAAAASVAPTAWHQPQGYPYPYPYQHQRQLQLLQQHYQQQRRPSSSYFSPPSSISSSSTSSVSSHGSYDGSSGRAFPLVTDKEKYRRKEEREQEREQADEDLRADDAGVDEARRGLREEGGGGGESPQARHDAGGDSKLGKLLEKAGEKVGSERLAEKGRHQREEAGHRD